MVKSGCNSDIRQLSRRIRLTVISPQQRDPRESCGNCPMSDKLGLAAPDPGVLVVVLITLLELFIDCVDIVARKQKPHRKSCREPRERVGRKKCVFDLL